MDPKLNISVITGSNKRLSWEVNPPPLDQPILVPVAVRSAQTGDLIAGAQVAILDTKTNETISITLASGSGTVNLRETTSFRYHASAAAANYTLISPIVFGVVEGTSIVLWMSPDAPPDDPIEEGKSMLYGYVQTQGSQQPISGATVSLDGYGSTTTSSTGFYIFNNVTPGTYTISASATLHTTLSEPVTVDATATQHNLALAGHYLLTVTIKDGDTLTNLQNATITLSDGQESTTNPATFTVDYGPYTISAAAEDHYPTSQSAYLDSPGTTAATVLLTAKTPTPEMPNYPPHNVQFKIMNLFGAPIAGVNVTATGYETTAESWDWIYTMLGLSTDIQIEGTEMTGTTGSDGCIDFMMFESVKYTVNFTKTGEVAELLTIYPHESYYPVYAISLSSLNPFYEGRVNEYKSVIVNVSTSTSGSDGTVTVRYQDQLNATTGGTVALTQTNSSSGEEDTLSSYSISANAFSHDFDITDCEGQSYFVRVRATHGNITGGVNRDFGVTFPGERLNFGLPNEILIWAAMFIMTVTALMFGPSAAIQGLPVICFEGWLFLGIGWLRDLGDVNAAGLLVIMSFVAVVANIMGASKRARQQG